MARGCVAGGRPGREGDAVDVVGVAAQRHEFLAGFEVPQLDGFVMAGRREDGTIRMMRKRGDDIGVPEERMDDGAGASVPDLDFEDFWSARFELADARGGELFSVGAKIDSGRLANVG